MQKPLLSMATRLSYGVGAAAYGIKENGFSTFLLIFYSQVLGLNAFWVGLIIMVALVVDGFIDPLIGSLSDGLQSRWARRHPFMYGAALPTMICYTLIWIPPTGVSDQYLYLYLLGIAIATRLVISCFEIPSSSLAAELSSDYDERTRLLSYRSLFGWIGGVGASYLALRFLFQPDASHPNVFFSKDGFAKYGYFASFAIFLSILGSALGTHSRIHHLSRAPKNKAKLSQTFSRMFTALRNPAFARLIAGNLFIAMSWGISSALSIYIALYYWGFSTLQLSYNAVSALSAAIVAFCFAGKISAKIGKMQSVLWIFPLSFLFMTTPYILRFAGFLPGNGSPKLLVIIITFGMLGTACVIICNIVALSMMADVVEDYELKSERRSEGMFFASSALVNKSVTGVGIFSSGLILSIVQFPRNAVPGNVDPQILNNLIFLYVAIIGGCTICAVAIIRGYPINRDSHEKTLRILDERKASAMADS